MPDGARGRLPDIEALADLAKLTDTIVAVATPGEDLGRFSPGQVFGVSMAEACRILLQQLPVEQREQALERFTQYVRERRDSNMRRCRRRQLDWFLDTSTDGRFRVERVPSPDGDPMFTEHMLYDRGKRLVAAFDSAREARRHAQRLVDTE